MRLPTTQPAWAAAGATVEGDTALAARPRHGPRFAGRFAFPFGTSPPLRLRLPRLLLCLLVRASSASLAAFLAAFSSAARSLRLAASLAASAASACRCISARRGPTECVNDEDALHTLVYHHWCPVVA